MSRTPFAPTRAHPSGPAARSTSRSGPARSGPAKPAGPSQRQLRVGELIRRTLSEILSRGGLHDPGLADSSITVGEVRVSPDLKVATAFVLPLGGGGGAEALEALARARPELRRLLGRTLTMRHVPDLRFRLDDTFDRIEETRRLFSDERVRRDVAAQEEPQGEPSIDAVDEAPAEEGLGGGTEGGAKDDGA